MAINAASVTLSVSAAFWATKRPMRGRITRATLAPSDRGSDAAERFPPDVRLARDEERGKEVSIEPLLIRDDGPRDQRGTQQRQRELDRDAKREACDHGAILMTELACVGRSWLLPA